MNSEVRILSNRSLVGVGLIPLLLGFWFGGALERSSQLAKRQRSHERLVAQHTDEIEKRSIQYRDLDSRHSLLLVENERLQNRLRPTRLGKKPLKPVLEDKLPSETRGPASDNLTESLQQFRTDSLLFPSDQQIEIVADEHGLSGEQRQQFSQFIDNLRSYSENLEGEEESILVAGTELMLTDVFQEIDKRMVDLPARQREQLESMLADPKHQQALLKMAEMATASLLKMQSESLEPKSTRAEPKRLE